MATAIGDLVVSLGVDNQQFVAALNGSGASLDEFAGHARGTSHVVEELGGEEGGSLGHSSRAFRFLGKSISEVGEKLGGVNSGFGESAGALGSTVSGLGEAAHGYHALHTVMDLAIVKQVALNALSPVGLATMAAVAVAGAAAYTAWGGAIAEWWEKRKKAEEEAKTATSETESTLKGLQKEAEQLNKTPLQRFQDELAKTGKSAEAIAEATRKFQELSAEVAKGQALKKAAEEGKRIEEELSRKTRELSEMGLTSGQKFAAEFSAQHPGATSAQREQAQAIGERQDQIKIEEKQRHDAEAQREHAEQMAKSIIQESESPIDKMLEKARTLQENFQRGLLDQGTYETALGAMRGKVSQELAAQKHSKDEGPAAALEYGSAQAFEEMYKRMNPDEQNEPNRQTAENTGKMHALLADIAKQLATPALRLN